MGTNLRSLCLYLVSTRKKDLRNSEITLDQSSVFYDLRVLHDNNTLTVTVNYPTLPTSGFLG